MPGMDWHDYQEKIIKYLEMEKFSSQYGWTPDQVRKLSKKDKRAYVAMMKGQGEGN